MFPRYAEGAIREALADTRVVAISGPRQAGKTTLARKIAGRERTFLTLDDAAVLASARRDPNGLVRGLDTAVIDEIQRAPELLLAIKQSVDEDTRPGRFLITGSADLQATRVWLQPSTLARIATELTATDSIMSKLYSGQDFDRAITIEDRAGAGHHGEPIRHRFRINVTAGCVEALAEGKSGHAATALIHVVYPEELSGGSAKRLRAAAMEAGAISSLSLPARSANHVYKATRNIGGVTIQEKPIAPAPDGTPLGGKITSAIKECLFTLDIQLPKAPTSQSANAIKDTNLR